MHQVTNGSSSYEKQDSSSKLKAPHRNRFFLVATPHGASTALCQNEYANIEPDYPFCPRRNLLLRSVTWICREINGKSDSPDAQPVLVRVDRWMAYDDHYLGWSRVQQ